MEIERRILLKFRDQYNAHLKSIQTVNLNLRKINLLIANRTACSKPTSNVKLIKKDLVLMKKKSKEDDGYMRTRWKEIKQSCAQDTVNRDLIDAINILISNKIGRPKNQRCKEPKEPSRSEPSCQNSVKDSPKDVPNLTDQEPMNQVASDVIVDKTNELSHNKSLNVCPLVPRKRGRPKKQISCIDNSFCSVEEEPSKCDWSSQQSGEHAHRGDSTALQNASAQGDTEEKITQSETKSLDVTSAVPKKRGRPRKEVSCDTAFVSCDAENPLSSEPSEHQEHQSAGESQTNAPGNQKKKISSGLAEKAARTNEINSSFCRLIDTLSNKLAVGKDSVDVIQAVPRRVGRPRKKIVTSNIDMGKQHSSAAMPLIVLSDTDSDDNEGHEMMPNPHPLEVIYITPMDTTNYEEQPSMCDPISQQSEEHLHKDDSRAPQNATEQGDTEEKDKQPETKRSDVSNAVPRKRGRPRKEITCKTACVGCDAEKPRSSGHDTSEQQAETTKCLVEVAAGNNEGNDSVAVIQAMPRKRGRPRKKIICTLIDDPSNAPVKQVTSNIDETEQDGSTATPLIELSDTGSDDNEGHDMMPNPHPQLEVKYITSMDTTYYDKTTTAAVDDVCSRYGKKPDPLPEIMREKNKHLISQCQSAVVALDDFVKTCVPWRDDQHVPGISTASCESSSHTSTAITKSDQNNVGLIGMKIPPMNTKLYNNTLVGKAISKTRYLERASEKDENSSRVDINKPVPSPKPENQNNAFVTSLKSNALVGKKIIHINKAPETLTSPKHTRGNKDIIEQHDNLLVPRDRATGRKTMKSLKIKRLLEAKNTRGRAPKKAAKKAGSKKYWNRKVAPVLRDSSRKCNLVGMKISQSVSSSKSDLGRLEAKIAQPRIQKTLGEKVTTRTSDKGDKANNLPDVIPNLKKIFSNALLDMQPTTLLKNHSSNLPFTDFDLDGIIDANELRPSRKPQNKNKIASESANFKTKNNAKPQAPKEIISQKVKTLDQNSSTENKSTSHPFKIRLKNFGNSQDEQDYKVVSNSDTETNQTEKYDKELENLESATHIFLPEPSHQKDDIAVTDLRPPLKVYTRQRIVNTVYPMQGEPPKVNQNEHHLTILSPKETYNLFPSHGLSHALTPAPNMLHCQHDTTEICKATNSMMSKSELDPMQLPNTPLEFYRMPPPTAHFQAWPGFNKNYKTNELPRNLGIPSTTDPLQATERPGNEINESMAKSGPTLVRKKIPPLLALKSILNLPSLPSADVVSSEEFIDYAALKSDISKAS